MSKLIVVVGLTCNQSGSVTPVFLKEPGWLVRGITRNSSKAKHWADKGVDVVQADLDDPFSLTTTFTGTSAIFCVTDFWAPFHIPAN